MTYNEISDKLAELGITHSCYVSDHDYETCLRYCIAQIGYLNIAEPDKFKNFKFRVPHINHIIVNEDYLNDLVSKHVANAVSKEDCLNCSVYDVERDALITLQNAIDTIGERGEGYDDGNERSMTSVVNMFNTLTGHNLTVNQGWKFMVILKLVRSEQGEDKIDNYVDGSAYFALASEEINDEH